MGRGDGCDMEILGGEEGGDDDFLAAFAGELEGVVEVELHRRRQDSRGSYRGGRYKWPRKHKHALFMYLNIFLWKI